MRVYAAETERADGGAPRGLAVAGRPVPAFGLHAERAAGKLDLRARLGKICGGGEALILESEQDFHHAGGAGGGEQVADVGFYGAQGALAGAPAAFAPEGFQALDLDGVARRGAGGVALDKIHLGGRQAGLAVGRAHGVQLAGVVRGQQAAAYIVGQAYAGQDPVDLVAVAHRVGQALKDEHPGALADYQPVGGGVERGRHSGRREGAQLGEAHLGVKARRAGDSSGEHGVGAAGLKGVDGQFYGVERRGAGGVQGEAAARKAQRAGDDAAGQAGDAAVKRVGACF